MTGQPKSNDLVEETIALYEAQGDKPIKMEAKRRQIMAEVRRHLQRCFLSDNYGRLVRAVQIPLRLIDFPEIGLMPHEGVISLYVGGEKKRRPVNLTEATEHYGCCQTEIEKKFTPESLREMLDAELQTNETKYCLAAQRRLENKTSAD